MTITNPSFRNPMTALLHTLVLVSLIFTFPVSAAERAIPLLVTTQWVADHAKDKDLVILQTGFSRNEFAYGHVPNARFLWFNALAPSDPDLSTEMPGLGNAMEALQALGLGKDSRIVLVFTGQNIVITTRMFLALSYFGFGDRTAVMDGGLELWKSEGRPLARGRVAVAGTSLTLSPEPNVITNIGWVKERLADPAVTIVDARAKNFYDGMGGGIARTGHIAGARSLVFNTLVDSLNRMRTPAELQGLFDSAGVKRGSTVVSYCHVGQQATLVYFAARLLGYDAKVYDGSFEEWNVQDDSFPVEKGIAPPK